MTIQEASLSGDGVFAGQRSDKVDSGRRTRETDGRRTHQSEKRWTSGKDLLGVTASPSGAVGATELARALEHHKEEKDAPKARFALALADNPAGASTDPCCAGASFPASSVGGLATTKVPSLMASPVCGHGSAPQTTFISSKVL